MIKLFLSIIAGVFIFVIATLNHEFVVPIFKIGIKNSRAIKKIRDNNKDKNGNKSFALDVAEYEFSIKLRTKGTELTIFFAEKPEIVGGSSIIPFKLASHFIESAYYEAVIDLKKKVKMKELYAKWPDKVVLSRMSIFLDFIIDEWR